jgi:uncharacterized protein (DUF2141 family)
MKINQGNKILFLFLLMLLLSLHLSAQNIEVLITGIRSEKGKIQLKVYKDDKSFQSDQHFKVYQIPKTESRNGQLIYKLTLPPGIYGMALLDDENADGEMNYNFVGFPKEGFGFSNFYLTAMAKPKFEAFQFRVQSGTQYKVNMKIKYM